MTMPAQVDTVDLLRQVKALYRRVALEPHGSYHFPLGRPLAEQLGYPADLLDRIPTEALASFAGVGYALDLARLTPGEHQIDFAGADDVSVATTMQVKASSHQDVVLHRPRGLARSHHRRRRHRARIGLGLAPPRRARDDAVRRQGADADRVRTRRG